MNGTNRSSFRTFFLCAAALSSSSLAPSPRCDDYCDSSLPICIPSSSALFFYIRFEVQCGSRGKKQQSERVCDRRRASSSTILRFSRAELNAFICCEAVVL